MKGPFLCRGSVSSETSVSVETRMSIFGISWPLAANALRSGRVKRVFYSAALLFPRLLRPCVLLPSGIRAEGGFSCHLTSEDRKCSSTHRARALAAKATRFRVVATSAAKLRGCGRAQTKKTRAKRETPDMGLENTHNDGCQWHTSNFCVRQFPAAPIFGRPVIGRVGRVAYWLCRTIENNMIKSRPHHLVGSI